MNPALIAGIIEAIKLANTLTTAAIAARQVAAALKESAQQSQELTPEQSAALDAEAITTFESPASQPSGR